MAMSASSQQRLGMSLCVLSLSVFVSFVSAQSANTVLLESLDKSVAVSGELVAAENGQYQLSTIAGVISMDVNDVKCTGEACPLLVPDFEPGAEVSLFSSDGAINITGKLTDYADNHYVLENAVAGSFTLSADVVECSGSGCPSGMRFANQSALNTESATANTVRADTTPVAETESVDPANARISFAGSDTVGIGLLPFLLEDYADSLDASAQTDILSETETFVRYVGPADQELSSIYVNATGSGDAADALETKAAIFGMTSRPLDNEEARRLIAAGSSDLRNSENETVIAVDSLAVITHPSNSVKALSLAEIGAIYLGKIDNWSQVGGANAPITVLSREDGSSTRGVFESAVFDGEQPTLAERVTYPGGDNPEISAAVKNDPLAIGYVGFAYSEGLNRLDLTSECGITSTATPFAVKTEEYPLGRRLYLYNRADNTPEEASRFLEYVLSPDADDAIASSNFVNFSIERNPLNPSRYDGLYEGLSEPSIAQLADQLKADLNLWDRFSTTVRFRSGSFRLDKKELNDIDRLVSTLSELPQGTASFPATS